MDHKEFLETLLYRTKAEIKEVNVALEQQESVTDGRNDFVLRILQNAKATHINFFNHHLNELLCVYDETLPEGSDYPTHVKELREDASAFSN